MGTSRRKTLAAKAMQVVDPHNPQFVLGRARRMSITVTVDRFLNTGVMEERFDSTS
jgi:hypothetical protein